jgi:golgi phosphoprotein 3
MLNIPEALFILALDEEEGEIYESVANSLEFTLAGAVLAELVLQNRIELADHRVMVTDQTQTECPILDQALFDILDTSRPRKLKYWINTLVYKKIQAEVGHQLVEKGVLARKKKRLRQVIPVGENQEGNGTARHSLKKRLREIVFAGQAPDLSEKVLLAFLAHSELFKLVFKHGDRKAARQRVKNLIKNDEEGIRQDKTLDEIVDIACKLDH